MSIFDSDAFNRTLFFPRADVSEPPAGATDHFVDVGDAALHLRLHAAVDARATVLLFHGNGEVVADYDGAARDFARVGAALAVVDYRGYGRSSGLPSLRSIIEDAVVVLEHASTLVSGSLIVMGRSLGSACANELYGRNAISGVILESGFTDLDALLARRRMSSSLPIADDVFDPVPKLRRGNQPLLVLHGSEDTLIAPSEATAAFEAAATAHKELVLIEGRGHNDISFSPDYWSAISRFVTRVT